MPVVASDEKSGLAVCVATRLDELSPYADQWNRLAYESVQQKPSLSYAWISSFLEHRMRPRESWFCLLGLKGQELVGVLPVVVKPRGLFGLGPHRLCTPADFHTLSVDLLARPEHLGAIIPLFLRAIDKVQPRWFCLEVSHIQETSPSIAAIGAGLPGVTTVTRYDGFGYFLKLPENLELIRSTWSYNFRKQMNRVGRRLRELNGFKENVLRGKDATVESFQKLLDVEASGWKGRRGTAIKISPSLAQFYISLCQRLAEAGWLELYFLEVEGKTIAASMVVRLRSTGVGLKIAYDEAYQKYSPGYLIIEYKLREAIALHQIDTFDFVSDSKWQKSLGPSTRDYFSLYIYPRHPIPLLFGACPRKAYLFLRRVPGVLPVYRWLARLRRREERE
ncbi:MAG TPA: GNAT family N-acetyltransferase [Candidatus Deferrimicrobium sp.]|nr:GNAT family N-acetyltransferase [Candidatus Deferrimicrobium sp.]